MSALIEFAGSLLLISTTFTGVFQLGYELHSYNRLVNAVREGARYASIQPMGQPLGQPAAVRRMVVYGNPNPAPNARPLLPGLSEKNVQLIVSEKTMTVAIRDFQLDGLFSKLVLDGKPTVTFPCTNGVGK